MNKDILTLHAFFEEIGSYLTVDTLVNSEISIIKEAIAAAVSLELHDNPLTHIGFSLGVPLNIQLKVNKDLNCKYIGNQDGYVIEILDGAAAIYAESERGLFYGALSLSELAVGGFVNHGLIYNSPSCAVRGLKLYLPAPEDIVYFKSVVDLLCRYHYNTLLLEVGGAMEYKRHPEINEGWVAYCAEMSEYSGKTVLIQEQTFPWYKNSMHVENGGGQFLTQNQVKDLVDYCKERYLEVIPEVPALSHCDYLLIRHPELAERKNDPYPDTYCPSDPRSYELLFDVLDEVIAVFEPQMVHVGHDEYYSVGLCDSCKGKAAEQLYADDLRLITEFLEDHGVKTMIWCEKLINAVNRLGKGFGGAEIRMANYETGADFGETVPPIYTAIDLVQQKVHMLHWYWGMDKSYDKLFLERGMQLTFGNFDGPAFADWSERIVQGALGGINSNWSSVKASNMQRNGILFSIVYSAYMFWHADYKEEQFEEVAKLALEALFNERYRAVLDSTGTAAGPTNIGTTYIEVTHTTDELKEYRKFFDGIFLDNEEYRLGAYLITFEDGSEWQAPIYYGFNISNKDRFWSRSIDREDVFLRAQYEVDQSLFETSFTTLPTQIDGETFYKWIIENPHPTKTISNIRLINDAPATYNITVKKINVFPYSPAFALRQNKKEQIQIRGEGTLA